MFVPSWWHSAKFAILVLLFWEVVRLYTYRFRDSSFFSPYVHVDVSDKPIRTAKTKTTSYFQDLCQRNDVLPLPLQCRHNTSSTRNTLTTTPTTNVDMSLLSAQLDCYNSNDNTNATNIQKSVNFFSFAHNKQYTDMLPLYAFFALMHNPNSVVEMVVHDITEFITDHSKELVWLLEQFDGPTSLCVRMVQEHTIDITTATNSWRFLERPVRHATYTYIGDVDIFLKESVLDKMRLQQMKYWNLPYSNIIRPNTNRLTGVILLETDRFYTDRLLQIQRKPSRQMQVNHDEVFLYNLVNISGIGLPGTNFSDPLATYRPLHGLHLSTNRGPDKRFCLPNFDSQEMDNWCSILSTPKLHDFLCQVEEEDTTNILLDSITEVSIQMEYNMTTKTKKTIQSSDNKDVVVQDYICAQ